MKGCYLTSELLVGDRSVVDSSCLTHTLDETHINEFSQVFGAGRSSSVCEFAILTDGDCSVPVDVVEDELVMRLEARSRVHQSTLHLSPHPKQLINDSFSEVFKPGGEVDTVFDVVVVPLYPHGTEVPSHVLVVEVLKANKGEEVEAQLSQENLGQQPGGSPVPVHKGVDDHELFVEDASDNYSVEAVFDTVVGPVNEVIYHRWDLILVWRQEDWLLSTRVVDEHWIGT